MKIGSISLASVVDTLFQNDIVAMQNTVYDSFAVIVKLSLMTFVEQINVQNLIVLLVLSQE